MIFSLHLVYPSNLPQSDAVPWHQSAFSMFVFVWKGYDRNSHFSHRSRRKCSYVLVRTSTWPTNLMDRTRRRCDRGRICSYLIGGDGFIFYKKVTPFFGARAAAPVATTTLGLRSCTCARPKEVVDWYTNGGKQRKRRWWTWVVGRVKLRRVNALR